MNKNTIPGLGCLAMLFTAALAHSTHAASITNAGFETVTFTVWPGYISDNGLVTGWTHTIAANQGINPSSGSPFANNGTIPQGSQVGFIQYANTFSNTITGLTAGTQYELSFRVNARDFDDNTPTMSVAVGGSTLVSSSVTPVGGVNPYGYVVRTFTATGPSMSLEVSNTAGGNDNTLLIDDFQVTAQPVAPWSIHAWTNDADSGIVSGATYTHLYNLGATTNPTINDQTFTGVAGVNPSVAGVFSLTSSNAYTDDANNVTGSSATLANDFVYNGNPAVLTLEGLLDGQSYRTSIFGVGFDATANRTATFEANGERFTVDESQAFGDNNGVVVDYEFVASGTSQMINIDPLGGNTFHIYGFANLEVAVVPEPSTLFLATLGLIGFGIYGWRRRRQKAR